MMQRRYWLGLFVLGIVGSFASSVVLADPPEGRVIIKHDDDDDDNGHKVTTRVIRERVYVPTRREYAHVRLTRMPVVEGRPDDRTIVVRSARVQPYVIERYEPRTRDNLHLVIRHFKEGRPTEAIPLWTTFVESLPAYQQPVDLDELMLFIARESCLRDNNASLLQAMRLDFLEDSVGRIDQYLGQLRHQQEICNKSPGHCAPDTIRYLNVELARTESDLRNLGGELDRARNEFETRSRDSSDFERCVASVYDQIYRVVEPRIIVAP